MSADNLRALLTSAQCRRDDVFENCTKSQVALQRAEDVHRNCVTIRDAYSSEVASQVTDAAERLADSLRAGLSPEVFLPDDDKKYRSTASEEVVRVTAQARDKLRLELEAMRTKLAEADRALDDAVTAVMRADAEEKAVRLCKTHEEAHALHAELLGLGVVWVGQQSGKLGSFPLGPEVLSALNWKPPTFVAGRGPESFATKRWRELQARLRQDAGARFEDV